MTYESIIHCHTQEDAIALMNWCMRNNVSATRSGSAVRMGHIGKQDQPLSTAKDNV